MNNIKPYTLYVPSVFPKGHRREGRPTMFLTKILNTIESRGGWRKTFILKHGFRGWQYKIDNVIKGYASLTIAEKDPDGNSQPFAKTSNVFYQKVRIVYDVCHDALDIEVDRHKTDEELFLSGIGLSRTDFLSMYIRKKDNKSIIHYDGIMIILSSSAVF